jgi:hypothetical protein
MEDSTGCIRAFLGKLPESDIGFKARTGPKLAFVGKEIFQQMGGDAGIFGNIQNDLIKLVLPISDSLTGYFHPASRGGFIRR